MGQLHKAGMIFVVSLGFLVAFAGVHGTAGEKQNDSVGLINVKKCEGVAITQCEVAKNLINTLKMGEDLTCGACFIHLQALGIAPGEDWSYGDPHKVITQKEMKEVILETQLAYNNGTVRLDAFEAAAGINGFCRDMRGPTPAEGVATEEGTSATTTQESDMQKETSE